MFVEHIFLNRNAPKGKDEKQDRAWNGLKKSTSRAIVEPPLPAQKSKILPKYHSGPPPNVYLSFSEDDVDDMSFTECLRRCHFLYEPITPQLLIGVLKHPEFLESGATVDTIISKLRALKLHLNPAQDLLKKELLQKLNCCVKLGLITEKKGLFRVAEAFARKKLPRRKVDAFWNLWFQNVPTK